MKKTQIKSKRKVTTVKKKASLGKSLEARKNKRALGLVHMPLKYSK